MKTNTSIFFLAAVIVVIGAIWVIGTQPSVTQNNAPERSRSDSARGAESLSADESFFNFGSISMAAGKVSHAYKIKNTGSDPIAVKKIYTSCMCTTAKLIMKEGSAGPFGMPGHAAIPTISERIAPNEEASVEVVFDPAAHGPGGVGKVRRVVYIETDAQKEPFELSFEANVTP